MDDAEQAEFFSRTAAVGDEPATEYGFVGRDLDIQAIEHRLLTVGGQQHAGGAGHGRGRESPRCWRTWPGGGSAPAWSSRCSGSPTRTGPGRPGRSSGRSGPGCCPPPITPAPTPCPRPRRPSRSRNCSALPGTCSSWTTRVGHRRARRHPSRPEPGRAAGPEEPAVGELRGGQTLVLLGSRQAETWLSAAGPPIRAYPLPGLDPQAASELADRILTRHGADRHLSEVAERDALAELVNLLGGYPLPLTVVLPVLASTPPSAVLAELQAGGQPPTRPG